MSTPRAETPPQRERAWRMAAGITSLGVAVWVLARLPAPGGGWGIMTAAAVLASALALLLLRPPAGGCGRWWLRAAGYAAAALALMIGLSGWVLPGWAAAMTPLTHFCFTVLAASLLCKRWFSRLAVFGDLLVAFVGLTVCLDYCFRAPNVVASGVRPMHWETALVLLLLAGAWMAAWPERRPVSFYLEAGSAATVLRRLLPVTLLYPILLVGYNAARGNGDLLAMRVTQAVIIFGTILFGAALLWLIAHELDRRDTMAHLTSLDLRASERRYRQQFDNNPQPMWVFSIASLRFLEVNESAVREFGYTREEFLNMSVLDIRPPEDRARARAVVKNAQPAKGWLWRYRTKSGELLEAEAFAQPVDWHGEPAFLSFINDVTARRRTEHQLHEQEDQVRTLLESTSEGIFTLDLEGKCVWCNPAAASLLGLASSTHLVGRQVHALAHHTRGGGQPFPAEACNLLQAVRSGQAISLDEEMLWRADGASFPADIRCNPLYREGKLAGAVIAVADVSERRSLRGQIQQAQKMEAVGRLAAGIAHDFNNLLTVINGYADMLLQREHAPMAPDRQHNALDSIRKAGERAALLTRQLLAFSRQQVIEPKLLNLNSVLEEMDPLLRRVLSEDIELALACEAHLGTVRADPGQLGQILMNLVVNARDAMPHGGRITIETANVVLDASYAAAHAEVVPGEYALVAVSDTGTGMDAGTLSHLFEPFFTTKPVGKGTGLGLATVFGIVKQSGGTVAAYSEPGHGTAIKVYLPRVAPAEGAPRPYPPGAVAGGHETILLVEDEDAVRQLACAVLRARGYNVMAASRPSQALEIVARHTGALDMVMTDVIMPEMDGRRLARQIAAHRPGLAVLYASGFPDRAITQHHDLAQGTAFIQKPFTPDALIAKVRAVLDEHRPELAAAG